MQMEAAGKALIEIRDRKLYRAEFGTFKEYVRIKWEMPWQHAYRLCDAATVLENLKESHPMGELPMPKNERQARELAKLEPEQQVAVWTEAVPITGS